MRAYRERKAAFHALQRQRKKWKVDPVLSAMRWAEAMRRYGIAQQSQCCAVHCTASETSAK